MRLWLILLVGLLTFAITSCPTPEEDTGDTPLIDDEGMRQPDFTTDDTAVTEDEAAAVVCEVCGMDPCTCAEMGDEAAEGEDEAVEGEDEGAEDEGEGDEPEPEPEPEEGDE